VSVAEKDCNQFSLSGNWACASKKTRQKNNRQHPVFISMNIFKNSALYAKTKAMFITVEPINQGNWVKFTQ